MHILPIQRGLIQSNLWQGRSENMGEAIVGRVGTEAKKTTSQRAQLLNQLSLIIGNNSEVLGAYFANPKEV